MERMKVVAFNGSPKGAESNTHVIVDAFLEGAAAAGADVENVFLAEKKIAHCLGCFGCWSSPTGECVQKDDMEELIEKYTAADIVVFATPLHNDNVSSRLKMFIDRLLPLGNPYFAVDREGETIHPSRGGKIPKFVMISNCGFPEQSHFQVLHLLTERMARNYKTEFIAEIYRGGGAWLTEPSLDEAVARYRDLVRKAGEEVVMQGRLSGETKAHLEQPLIPSPDYIEIYRAAVNRYWDEVLGGNK
ncbi:MAG TPA: flavodoxin family protein [Methanofollis liminatans]|uniref:Flavodoxin family protein n=1 Tax=Methanofollis liminatans TaxID=2201 RepID=A0A831LXZ9_9EURY|nr:flavodoxin family protein [Methanofollis liminatans]